MSIYFCVCLGSIAGEEVYVFRKIDRNFMNGPVFEMGFKIVIKRHSFEVYINKIYSISFEDLSLRDESFDILPTKYVGLVFALP